MMTKNEQDRLSAVELDLKEIRKDVEAITKNHLPHINDRLRLQEKALGNLFKLVAIGLALITILVAIR